LLEKADRIYIINKKYMDKEVLEKEKDEGLDKDEADSNISLIRANRRIRI